MPSSDIQAANTNHPLWQRVTLRVALDHSEMDNLSASERKALLEKAVATMKPTAEEQQQLATGKEAEDAYMLSFVKAYRAGMPPLAQLAEAIRQNASE